MPSTGKSEPSGRTPVLDVLGQMIYVKISYGPRETNTLDHRLICVRSSDSCRALEGSFQNSGKRLGWHSYQTSFRIPHIARSVIMKIVSSYRLNHVMYSRMRGLNTGYHCLYFSFAITSKKREDTPPSRPVRSRSSRVMICACSMRGRRSVALPNPELDRISSKMSSTMWLARSPIQWIFYAGSLIIGDTKSKIH